MWKWKITKKEWMRHMAWTTFEYGGEYCLKMKMYSY